MPNTRYPLGDEGLLDQSVSLIKGQICVMLVQQGYRFSTEHRTLADVAPWDNGRSDPLQEVSVARGVFDAADTDVRALQARPTAALVIFQRGAADAESRLIHYIDEGDLPFTPAAGQRVPIEWDNGPNKIFRL